MEARLKPRTQADPVGKLDAVADTTELFLVARVAGQSCALPVLAIRDVLGPQVSTRIPLAPRAIAGSLNLRGRIVTVIDLRARLGLPGRGPEDPVMNIVIDQAAELYSFQVDGVGEVMGIDRKALSPIPQTLDDAWKAFVVGVQRMPGGLLLVLDVSVLLALEGLPE